MSRLRDVLLEHVRKREKRTPSDYWHPSSLGQCDRRAVLGRAGVKGNDPDDETLLKFWIGEVLHKALQDVLSAEVPDEVIGHEVPVRSEEYRVSGRMDSLLRTGTGGQPWEFKSVDSNAFRYGDYPKDHHVLQEAMYLVFGPFADGLLAYIGKQDGKIHEFTVHWTAELDEQVKSYIRKLDGLLVLYLNEVMPPAIDAPKSDWRIKYCDYRGTGVCCGDEQPAMQSERALGVRPEGSEVPSGGVPEPSADGPSKVQAPRKRKKEPQVEPRDGMQEALGL